MLDRVSLLAAKIEATVGTDATPGASDATDNIFNAKIEPMIEMEEREGQGGFDRLSAQSQARMAKVTFKTYCEWDGTATEPSWADKYFPACGWVKSGQVYTPKSEAPGTNVKTLTFSHYIDGTLRKVTGAVGTFKATLISGKLAFIDWEFTGCWAGESSASILTPTYTTNTNYKWASGVCQWNDVDLRAAQAVIDAGNVIHMREDPSTASGYISGIITDRYPKITIDPEKVVIGTQDRHSLWLANTEYALELHLGGVGNSKLQFDAPKAQILKITHTDRDKLTVDSIEMACNKNGTNQDQCLSITFTAAT